MKTYPLAITTEDPDIVGEFWRDEFFDQADGKTGCYSTFKLRIGIKELPNEPVYCPSCEGANSKEPDFKWDCAKTPEWSRSEVKMRYYWDGDGCLQFIFPNGAVLENSDCKKTYGWKWLDDIQRSV